MLAHPDSATAATAMIVVAARTDTLFVTVLSPLRKNRRAIAAQRFYQL
jgi:hypothetical protein